ncbi:PTS transporter subunit IIC [Bifidobacterium aquikefiricola]|uniref:PTS transporter subunit IIC n=1 Tax=Bifidobacterium aquikefiricola TaxID=3059038 RepID=A0AB39U6M5_9BIFI
MNFINTIVSLGAAVMMPIIFFVVGLIFKLGIGKSFKAGMTVGVGFVGVSMVINLLLTNLGPASKAMVNRLGMHLNVVDVGWPTASTIGWGTPIMAVTVIGFIAINALMLFLKFTKTVDVDFQLLEFPSGWRFGLCGNKELLVCSGVQLDYFCGGAQSR